MPQQNRTARESERHPVASGENTANQHPPSQEEELQALRAERAMLMDRLARQQAEFENARKRSVKAQADFREYALVDIAKSLLPVLDSLERALAHEKDAKEFSTGLQLIHRQLQDTLNKMGVKQIATEGEQFNPEFHEAVEAVASDSEGNLILDELQPGYIFKDRLLRPAMVRVSRRN